MPRVYVSRPLYASVLNFLISHPGSHTSFTPSPEPTAYRPPHSASSHPRGKATSSLLECGSRAFTLLESLIALPLARRLLATFPSSQSSLISPGLFVADHHLLTHTYYLRQLFPLLWLVANLHHLLLLLRFGGTPQWGNALLNHLQVPRFPGLRRRACPCSQCQFGSNPFASKILPRRNSWTMRHVSRS